MSKVNEFCNKLFEYAKKNCTGEFEIQASDGEDFSVDILNGQINNYSVNDGISVTFKVKINGKLGYASTTALEESGIPALVAAAEENAALIEAPDERFIFEGADSYPSPKVYGEELDTVSAEEKIELAKSLEKKALAYDERIIKVAASTVVSGKSVSVIKNSHGLDLSEASNYTIGYVAPIASSDGNMNDCYEGFGGFDRAALDPDESVRKAASEAIDFCGAKPVPGAQMRIIFRNNAFCDMLQTFSGIFSSENAQRGLSMLAGKEGEKIASDCVSITDDATLDHEFGSRAFDSEGVPSQRTAVVENGVLKTLLYNLKTANKAGVRSTGNASSAGSVVVTNFILSPGGKTLEELAEKMNNGLIITEVAGLHSGANAITGDFSLMAKGYLVTGGKRERAVSGVTVSGNFYELLKDIEETGSDTYKNIFGMSILSPSVLLASTMSVAGE